MIDLEACKAQARAGALPRFRGRVERVSGVLVEATGLRAAVGELCRIDTGRGPGIDADVVGFRDGNTLLMPHGELIGIAPRQGVVGLGRPFSIPVGQGLLGRVLDGFAQPIDGGPPLPPSLRSSVHRPAPPPMDRAPVRAPLQTGVRAIDAFTTLGRGQRLGIFAGSGVGKSSLLAQITRGTDAQIIIVCLVGERGREVRAFVDEVLAQRGRERSIVVVATSDRPPIERYLAPFTATTLAEHFRDQGQDVLLVMDSVTRFAAASREIGLAAGEPPTVRGYPPSFFATVPRLVERLGTAGSGSITGLLTVLLDADDPNDPVSDTLRGLLDGHVFLDRELAQRSHFPAIDVLGSLSRLMPSITSPEHGRASDSVRQLMAAWKEGRDLVEIGAYQAGSNPKLDRALDLMPAIETFTRQTPDDLTPIPDTLAMLGALQEAIEGRL